MANKTEGFSTVATKAAICSEDISEVYRKMIWKLPFFRLYLQKERLTTMMNELIDTLHTAQCSLVVLHEGNIVTFDGRGVRTLYHLLDNEPELLLGAKVAIKAVGRTAARAMATGGVVEVWADVISDQAYNTLHDNGVKVSYEKRVAHAAFLQIWERMGEIIDDK